MNGPCVCRLGAADAVLDRAAELAAVSAVRLWPRQWRQLNELVDLEVVGRVRERWGRLVSAAAAIYPDLPQVPAGGRWEVWSPAEVPDLLCELSGWDLVDLTALAVWSDPLGDPQSIARVVGEIDARMRWRALVPDAAAVLVAVDHGQPPDRQPLSRLVAAAGVGS